MRTKILVAFFFTAVFSGIVSGQGKITVKGEADIKVVPDQVVIAFTIETNDVDIDKSRTANDSKVSAVLAIARKLNIDEKSIQTDYINIEPRYSYGKDNEKKFSGYYVTKNITVILKDISKTDNLISEALKAGTNFVQSVDFRTSDLRKYQDEARLQAIRAAKEKAIALAAELGQKVHKPTSITEDVVYQTTSRGNRNMSQNYSKSVMALSDNFNSDSATTIAPGEIHIKAQVTVIFEME